MLELLTLSPSCEEPTFYADALSARQSIANANQIKTFTSDEQCFNLLKELIKDWKNVSDKPYEPDLLLDVLTTQEGWILLGKINNNEHVSPDEKKSTE